MNENTKILLFLLLSGLLIVSPYALRAFEGNPHMINSEAYYNIRINGYDTLQNRTTSYSILDHLNKNQLLFNRIIPVLCGILSAGLTLLILKKHNISGKNITATILLLISSPIFIYTFIDFKYFSFNVLLSLLIIYLIVSKKNIIAIMPFIIMPFIDLQSSLIGFLFIISYIFMTAKSYKNYYLLVASGIVSIIVAVWINLTAGHTIMMLTFENPKLVTDIGSQAGFSFSSIILTIIGLLLLWEKGIKNFFVYIFLTALVIISVFSTQLKAFMNYILVIYAGFAFIHLVKRRWSIQIIKKITLLLIICSIMFTTILYATKLSKSAPTPEYVDAINFIKEQSFKEETILSSIENGYLIEYFANRRVFVDQKSLAYESDRIKILDTLTLSRNLERTEDILKQYNIKYVFIDQSFRQKLETDEGLLFLIENSDKFKSIYKNEEVEVWIYTG